MSANASPSNRIRRAVFVPRFDGDASVDWYRWLIRRLAGLGIRSTVVPLLPTSAAPAIDATVAAIADVLGDDPSERAHTLLIGHSVGSRALLAYLDRHPGSAYAGLISVAGWFTLDQVADFPPLVPWVELDLDAAHFMTPTAQPVLDTVRAALFDEVTHR